MCITIFTSPVLASSHYSSSVRNASIRGQGWEERGQTILTQWWYTGGCFQAGTGRKEKRRGQTPGPPAKRGRNSRGGDERYMEIVGVVGRFPTYSLR